MDPYRLLNAVISRYVDILRDNLIGIYLHGSLAMGCFTERSDIDFLVVVKDPLDNPTKRALADELLQFQGLPEKGIEMSVILLRYAQDFKYPTPYELHYSEMVRERYLRDRDYICYGDADKDQAAHMTVIRHRGICLYGKLIKEVFANIPKECFIDSILCDIKDAREGIRQNPVYYLLNLCRVLHYLRHDKVLSKLEGGLWGIEQLPEKFRPLLENAVGAYRDQQHIAEWNHDELIDFAQFMMKEIYSLVGSGQGGE
ncbi:MAG TPA: DUF4111 domain-containing protein [Thermoclostridium sp.]|uniref:aminoglycoside adenylyltransferase domain-containing protein n=1 Tax=Thermoclostridium caenicola TaxID=659425 RepID=UPI002C93E683|nr:aminoglycoside adenylyltransferase domain-containing protein [Thermoclostridium caenicola]HOK42387.1 DUF4111 domain-containing protein [Thermoclostridium caenicola]HOL83843.1 DUF4111 domain-containing protein [Thermoclostridium caenicola]HOQ76823.1 DUF4111 domain-containing protein [Thermoclostridium sp.]HPO77482.1 DUF4111 domain-containing protein [Thermoclostridium caenicola]